MEWKKTSWKKNAIQNQYQVLLIKRGKNPMKGAWSFPGGGVELGESIKFAAKREIQINFKSIIKNSIVIQLIF